MKPAYLVAAEKMVADACRDAYNALPKKDRHWRNGMPYSVPDWCRPLLDAANAGDEHETKRIMYVVRQGAFSLV